MSFGPRGLLRGRSASARSSRSLPQEISKGCRVAVLQDKHFPSFGPGDEGVVLSVDFEALNCHVQFDRQSRPVPVALRHLRVISSPKGLSEDASSSKGWSAFASLVRGPEAGPFPEWSGDSWRGDGQFECPMDPLRGGLLDHEQLHKGGPFSRHGRAASVPPGQGPPALGATDRGGCEADIRWRASRLEAVEARLAETEEEYRTEVACLAHALKECVNAITTVSRVINTMSITASEKSSDWEHAAAALHDAACIGSRALGGASIPFSGRGDSGSHRFFVADPQACCAQPATQPRIQKVQGMTTSFGGEWQGVQYREQGTPRQLTPPMNILTNIGIPGLRKIAANASDNQFGAYHREPRTVI